MAAPRLQPDENQELVRVLSGIPFKDPDYGIWWSTSDGQWLYARIAERIGKTVTSCINRQYGVSYEPEDLANTAFTLLREPFISAYVLRSADPWAYLAQVLKRDLTQQAGAYFRVQLTDAGLTRSPARQEHSAPVSIHEAARLTFEALEPLAHQMPSHTLYEAVLYFAERAHERISHLYTAATIDPELTGLGLGRNDILAVANAVLGSRPDHAHNSLLAGYLTNPSFNPRTSLLHRKALTKFGNRMAQAVPQQREVELVG